MMHYRKGENIEEEIRREELPFEDCWPNGQKDFLWMHVKGGTKVNNVITFAKNALDKGEYRTIVWTGAGGGLVKTVSCAEIIKRSHPLNQLTRMSYTNIDEHWLPQKEGLDEIIVKRKIPCLHILMSLDEIDESVNGVQKPNTSLNFFGDTNTSSSSKRHGQRFHGRGGGSQASNQNRNQNTGAKSDERPKKQHKYQKDKRENSQQEKPQRNSTQKNLHKSQSIGKTQPARDSGDKTVESKSPAENSTTASKQMDAKTSSPSLQ